MILESKSHGVLNATDPVRSLKIIKILQRCGWIGNFWTLKADHGTYIVKRKNLDFYKDFS